MSTGATLAYTVKFQHMNTTCSFIKLIHDNDSYPLQEKQSGKQIEKNYRIILTFPTFLLEKQKQQHQLAMSYWCSGAPYFLFRWLEPKHLMKVSSLTWGQYWLPAAAQNKDTSSVSPAIHSPRGQKENCTKFDMKSSNEITGLKTETSVYRSAFMLSLNHLKGFFLTHFNMSFCIDKAREGRLITSKWWVFR